MTMIIGIDPSLTGTGLALLDTDDHLVIPTETLTSTGKVTASTDERLERILTIVETVIYKAVEHKSDLAVIEAPAFSRNNAGTWDRAGLWWLLVSRLAEARIETTTIPPTTRAKYATGRGNAGKDEVLLAVAKRYPHVDVRDNNQADALVLAAIGAHLAGHPIDDLPKTHLDALAKVARPAGVAA
ncbi:crossover junction endodeoxyribonuclease RuvC [Janibacter terrae]|uniref:crossover junction endodeoxyribonuclease RuvC n=1 Tax=Janibacter terrae TaxID=103817 RepID=UPI0031F84C56